MGISKQIEQLITLPLTEEKIELVDIQFVSEHGKKILRIFIDKEGGISLNDCEHMSNKIGGLLDQTDIVKTSYCLEVSSPGVDKPLEQPFEYKRNIGRDLTVEYNENDEMKQVTGELNDLHNDIITILVGKKSLQIPISRVKRAQVKLKW